MKDIFDECRFGDFTLKSRIIRTGLWESQNRDNGDLKPEVFLRYERLAKSEVGLITTELISLYPNDRFSDYSHKLDYPLFFKDFKLLAEVVHEHSVPILAQIAFSDCNINGKQNISVNDLTVEDIRQIQSDYIVAARKFEFIDFDGIQLNIGNNYYLSKVINPKENRRKDDYGGNTFNRLRMILEIISVLNKTTGLHISCRINADEDALEVSRLLEKYGADSIQLTKPSSPQFFSRECRQKDALFDYADAMSKELSIPVVLGGGLTDMAGINDLINRTDIDFVSMQRPFVQNPTFLSDWKRKGSGESECITCNNCYWKKTSTCHIFHDEE